MRTAKRVGVIFAGYVLASFVASLLLVWAGYFVPGHGMRFSVAPIAIITAAKGAFFIMIYALIPVLPVIIYTEKKGIQSPGFYGVAGATAGVLGFGAFLLVAFFLGVSMQSGNALAAFLSFGPLFALPGLAAGLTYWLAAGRNAQIAT